MILAIKTDTEPSEIYLLDSTGEIVRKRIWSAGRSLAKDLLSKIQTLAGEDFAKIDGVIVYEGPGSFTGLRIGITVANAFAYAKGIRVIGKTGEGWIQAGIKDFASPGQDFRSTKISTEETSENGVIFREKSELENRAKLEIVRPNYGGEAHITTPKK